MSDESRAEKFLELFNKSKHFTEELLRENFYLSDGKTTLDRPLAAIPLRIKEQVIGVIAIYKLSSENHVFTAVDYETFALLAAHAATAIFSAKLYAQSERKLNTIQSFLDLLTTTS